MISASARASSSNTSNASTSSPRKSTTKRTKSCGHAEAKTMTLAVRKTQQIARPLKILIPLIQSELQQGNSAGREHYRLAGEMLLEAQDQVGRGNWSNWLKKNFDLGRTQAYLYMGWARRQREVSGGTGQMPKSLNEL